MLECPKCSAGADLTKDGAWAHCASCNTVFEPGKQDSQYKGSDSGSGDKEEQTQDGKDKGGDKVQGNKT